MENSFCFHKPEVIFCPLFMTLFTSVLQHENRGETQ
jgi:hypothetical protein